jgi:hypothetical protein
MSSWINQPYRPTKQNNLNTGFRQLLPQGTTTQKIKDATIVSAFYLFKGKRTLEEYKASMRIFLEGCPCKMIFYTEENMVPFIRECRRRYEDTTDVLVLPRKDWVANKVFSQDVWNSLLSKDVNGKMYSSDYYKFLYEKREFVKRAMAYNPFGHIDFIWVNPTICRDVRTVKLFKNFPVSSRIVTDRLMLINSTPFEYADEKAKNYGGSVIMGVRERNRINSSVIAGTKGQWINFSDMYESSVKKFQNANLFWGIDTIVMASIALENKQMISLIEPKPILDSVKGMTGLIYLGSPAHLFSDLTNKDTYDKKLSLEDLLNI